MFVNDVFHWRKSINVLLHFWKSIASFGDFASINKRSYRFVLYSLAVSISIKSSISDPCSEVSHLSFPVKWAGSFRSVQSAFQTRRDAGNTKSEFFSLWQRYFGYFHPIRISERKHSRCSVWPIRSVHPQMFSAWPNQNLWLIHEVWLLLSVDQSDRSIDRSIIKSIVIIVHIILPIVKVWHNIVSTLDQRQNKAKSNCYLSHKQIHVGLSSGKQRIFSSKCPEMAEPKSCIVVIVICNKLL